MRSGSRNEAVAGDRTPDNRRTRAFTGLAWPSLTQKALDRSNREPTRSFVYFIIDGERKMVKIGKATDPLKRLTTLQTASSSELKLAGVLAGGVSLEREIHARFADSHVRGEWFRVTDDVKALVADAAAAGTRKTDSEPTRRPLEYDDFSRPELTTLIDEFGQAMGLNREHARKYLKGLYEAGLVT